jgi:hypothetical protein
MLAHQESGMNEYTNMPFAIRKWKGTHKPELSAQNPVSEQVLRRIDYHDAKSYAIAGINKSLAAGQAPKGVTAAVAMREVIELADARAAEYQKHWESGWRQAGHIIVAMANELGKLRIRSTDFNGELLQELDMNSIKVEKNDYTVTYGLTSALSRSIPGLLQDMNELKDIGLADIYDIAEAVGSKVPDVQGTIDRVTSDRRLAAKQVQDAIERGEIPVPPSTMQGQSGLDAIVVLGKQAWCNAMINPDRYPPENVEALRLLMRAAQARKAPPQPILPTITPAAPMAPNAIVGIGTPSAGRIARNQYEARSMGLLPAAQAPGELPPEGTP